LNLKEVYSVEFEAVPPQVFNLLMPRMSFPLDVWSAKIFHVLFFGKEPEKPREVIPALKKVAEERWGEWRGYAFVYVLNDLEKLSKRVGFDLTQF
jgi:3-methyladenine DNA glycosylase/8-oxoguanine DNA glycosylase